MMRLVMAGACTLLLAGCGGDGSDTEADESTPTPAATETPASEGTATPTATATGTPTPSAPAEAVASKEGTLEGVPVRLEVVTLRRTGELAELELRLTNAADSGRVHVGSTFDGPEDTGGGSTVDGIYLVDAVNRKKYPVATDEEGVCVCSNTLTGVFLEPGDATTLSATFAAPPADAGQIDVSVPALGTLRDVPIG